jgi:hypothetical protein
VACLEPGCRSIWYSRRHEQSGLACCDPGRHGEEVNPPRPGRGSNQMRGPPWRFPWRAMARGGLAASPRALGG